MTKGKNLRAVGDRVEGLIQEIGQVADPSVRDKAEELVRSVMDLYGAALARVCEIADEPGSNGDRLINRLAADDLIASLLILHGLHPLDVETRIERALDRVRPYLGSHGGDVKLLGVREGVVSLRLEGSCHGCPSSTLTMKLAIEKAIEEAAPEVTRIEVAGELQSAAASSVDGTEAGHMGSEGLRIDSGEWIDLSDLPELAGDHVTGREIGGINVILCRLGETFFAYQDSCPSCRAALRIGALQKDILTCSSCGCGFDVRRAGQAVDASGLHMEPLPLLGREGGLLMAIPTTHT
jgi:Fe-S cluster biogenesis protein NfuA/nitrite reductase/ring-hydroxylating ferredoxin subunit